MNQMQFEMIVRIIKSGAPALAKELCECLVALIESEATLKLKVLELESKDCKCNGKCKTEPMEKKEEE